MRGYDDETRQNAFMVWCGEGEQHTAKTAELCGVSERTIFSWQRADDWRGRWLSSTAPEAEQAAAQGKTMMRYAMPVVAKRLLAIVGGVGVRHHALTGKPLVDAAGNPVMGWESSDRDAIQAAKILALYGLGSPLSGTDVGDASVLTASYSVPGVPEDIPEPGTETVAQLRAAAAAAIEATVQSVNTRTAPRRANKRV